VVARPTYSEALRLVSFYVRRIERELPIAGGATVAVVKAPMRCFGTCRMTSGGVEMEIAWRLALGKNQEPRRVTSAEIRDTIIHEYAHALDRNGMKAQSAREAHGRSWGMRYARVYQAAIYPKRPKKRRRACNSRPRS